MTSHYTMLWPSYRCDHVKAAGQENTLLRMVEGGNNAPSTFHSKIKTGDWLYPLCIREGDLYLIGGMKIAAKITREAYLAQFPHDARLFWHDCAHQVVTGINGAPIRFDRRVPASLLEHWRYQSGKEERALKHVDEGKITNFLSFHGVYRLSDAFAPHLHRLLYTDADELINASETALSLPTNNVNKEKQ